MSSTLRDPTLVLALVAVAEELSFSRAATRLGVTKGTISRKIARLEENAGTALVFRTTRTVSLTAVGRDLYERARGPVRALADMTLDLPQSNAELVGPIRLAAPQDVAFVMLPDVIERFLKMHPRVTFDVRVAAERINLVHAGVDLALRVSVKQMPCSSLITRRLREMHLGFFASPRYVAQRGQPRALGDPEHTWLTFVPPADPATTMTPRKRKLLGLPEELASQHRSDDFIFLGELARRGFGVAGLPLFVADPLVRAGELVAVLARSVLPVGATLHLVSPAQRKTSLRVTAFRQHLIDTLATPRSHQRRHPPAASGR